MTSWSIFWKGVISDFKDKGYIFNHIAEMANITIAKKMDMSYDFFIRHNLHAVEWKIIAMINRNKSLIKKLNRNWRHLVIRKFKQVLN